MIKLKYCLLILLFISRLHAKEISERIRLSGQVGAYYETYRITGRQSRRPPNTGRLYIRPTLDVFGLTLGIEAQVHTKGEKNYRAQNLNRYAIHPKWNWGSLSLGDFVPRWSQLTLSGVQVRGGGIEVNPRMIRFSTVGGRVFNSSRRLDRESFKRMMYGVSFGLGKRGSNFIDVSLLRTRDDPASYAPDPDQTRPVTPQENFVVATNTSLSLFKSRVRLQGELAGCAHNQDACSSRKDIKHYWKPFGALFRPRISSRIDYAYILQSTLQLSNYSLQANAKYIGPGYTSLGLAYLLNDRKSYSLAVNAKLWQNKIMVRGNLRSQRNNLLNHKKYTTRRRTANFGLNVRPLPSVFLALNANLNNIRNNASICTAMINTTIQGLTAISNFYYPLWKWKTNLSTTLTVQRSRDKNPMRRLGDVDVYTFNTINNVQFNSLVSANLSLNILRTRMAGQSISDVFGFGIGGAHSAFSRRLSSSLNLSINSSGAGRTLGIDFTSSYRLTTKDQFSVSFRNMGYVPDEEDILEEEESTSILPKRYNETIFTVQLTRNF